MTISMAELTKNIQFTIDAQGQVLSVVVPTLLWQQISAALEDAQDMALVAEMLPLLRKQPLGEEALRWEDIEAEWA